jgi:hypothetical protein
VLVHDGEITPDEIDKIQRADFTKYANPALSHAGSLYAEFWDKISDLAVGIGKAIKNAPAFSAKWKDQFQQRLESVYEASKKGNRIPPKTFVLKPSTPPRTPPKLTP